MSKNRFNRGPTSSLPSLSNVPSPPTNGPTADTGQTIQTRIGSPAERLQIFLYILMRKYIPFGKMEDCLTDLNGVLAGNPPYRFSNPQIARFSRDLAETILDETETNKEKGTEL